MKTFIRLWCEYDLGQDDLIFDSQETAYRWIKHAFEIADFDFSFKEVEDACLISYETVTLVENS